MYQNNYNQCLIFHVLSQLQIPPLMFPSLVFWSSSSSPSFTKIRKIYFLHPHFPSKPFLDCLGQACTHKPIAQKRNIIKNLIRSLVPISLPCGIANQPKKKIALQNRHLAFQVCAEFPWLCTICYGCTPCFLKDFSQAFMALHYLLPLHTLLFEGFFSSLHGFALSPATAHLAFWRIFLKLSCLCTICCCTPCFFKDFLKFPCLCTICCCCTPPCTKEAVPNSRFHGTCATTQKSILKSFQSPSLSAAWKGLVRNGCLLLLLLPEHSDTPRVLLLLSAYLSPWRKTPVFGALASQNSPRRTTSGIARGKYKEKRAKERGRRRGEPHKKKYRGASECCKGR